MQYLEIGMGEKVVGLWGSCGFAYGEDAQIALRKYIARIATVGVNGSGFASREQRTAARTPASKGCFFRFTEHRCLRQNHEAELVDLVEFIGGVDAPEENPLAPKEVAPQTGARGRVYSQAHQMRLGGRRGVNPRIGVFEQCRAGLGAPLRGSGVGVNGLHRPQC